MLDRQPQVANETSFANAGLIAPGHAYTWSSPKAPKILFRSLFRSDQALRLRLRADPRMWAWFRNCTAKRARINTIRKLRLCMNYQDVCLVSVADPDRATGGRIVRAQALTLDIALSAVGRAGILGLLESG